MSTSAEKVIEIARHYLGYEEKKSNKDLEDFHANVGRNNFTKFQPPLDGGCNGDQWCGYFSSHTVYEACGKDIAKACETIYAPIRDWMSGYTPEMASYFKKAGAWFTKPEPGDFAFFYVTSKKRIGHVGIVESVNRDIITFNTIEGNTSSSTFDDNGGCVARHSYSYRSVGGTNRVAGFGRPKYKKEYNMDIDKLIKEGYRTILGREVDDGGYQTWFKALQHGLQPADFIRSLAASNEKVTSLTTERRRLIRLAYMGALGREAESSEVDTWINTGLSFDEILDKIYKSTEYKERKAAIEAGES